MIVGMRYFLQRLRIPLLVLAILAVIGVLMSRYTSLDWLVDNDNWLRQTIAHSPITAGLIAFVIYVVVSLVPGTAGKSIVLGWLFGIVGGVLIVNFALVAAAVIAFLLSRHYFRDAVQSRFAFYLRPIQSRMQTDGAWSMLLLRLAHAPFTFMNYAAGAGTELPLRTFWWTTQLGLLPGNLVFVYAGTRLPTLEELLRVGPLGLLDASMIAALLSTAVVPFLIRKLLLGLRRPTPTAEPTTATPPPRINARRADG